MYSITCPAFACLSLLSHEMFYFLFRVLLSYSCFSQWWIVVICCVYMKLLSWWFRANSVTSGCREGEQGAETLNGHVKIWSYWWSGSCKHDHFFSPFLFLSFHLHNTNTLCSLAQYMYSQDFLSFIVAMKKLDFWLSYYLGLYIWWEGYGFEKWVWEIYRDWFGMTI